MYSLLPLVLSLLTSREEPVGVLDDGLDDADDLQGNCRHHLCDVPAANRGGRDFCYDGTQRRSRCPDHKNLRSGGD